MTQCSFNKYSWKPIKLLAAALLLLGATSLFAHNPNDSDPPPDPTCEKKKCNDDCPEGGDPINLATGEFYLNKSFLEQPDAALPFLVDLHYHTFSDYNGPAGVGWTFNYNMRLFKTNKQDVANTEDLVALMVRQNTGKQTPFEREFVDGAYLNSFRDTMNRDETIVYDSSNDTYILYTNDRTEYHFDTEGKLTRIANGSGYELRMTYTTGGKLPVTGLPMFSNFDDIEVVLRDYQLSDVDEYLNGIATGRFYSYTYDPTTNRLDEIIDQDGHALTFVFDTNGPSGATQGQLLSLTDQVGYRHLFTYYDEAEDMDRSYYRLMKTFLDEGCSTCTQRTNTYEDFFGNQGALRRSRVISQWQGNLNNGVPEGEYVEDINYSSSYTEITYKIATEALDGTPVIQQRYERYTFSSVATGEKKVARIEKWFQGGSRGASDNYVETRNYFSSGVNAGKLEQKTIGSNSLTVTTIDYTYDDNGNLTESKQSVDGMLSLVKASSYDSLNNLLLSATYYLNTQTDAVEGEIFLNKYEYYANTTQQQYERMVTNPPASLPVSGDIADWDQTGWAYITTEFKYDSDGRLEERIDPNGRRTKYEYTSAENKLAITREYDPDNTSDETIYTYDSNGYMDTMTDALGRVTDYTYDALGRLLDVTDPNDFKSVTTYSPDSNVIMNEETMIKTGFESRKVEYGYDGLGRRTRVSRYNSSNDIIPKTVVGFDSEGRMISNIAVASVDGSLQPDVVLEIRNEFDAFGNLLKTKIPHPDFSSGSISEYDYDTINRKIYAYEPAPLEGNSNNLRTTEYIYDGLNRLVAEIRAKGVVGVQVRLDYDYDALGNLTKVNYSGDYNGSTELYEDILETNYYYDAVGRQVGINWDPANATPDASGARELPILMTLDDASNVTMRKDGEGNATNYYYDDDSRLLGINWDPTGDDLPDASYEGQLPMRYRYNLVGSRISQTDGEGNTTYFKYDDLNRLTHISVPQGDDFDAADLSGNWWETLSNVMQATSYNAWGQATGATSYLSGTAHGTTSTGYDRFGRMTESTNLAGLTLSYVYNNLDQLETTTYPEVNSGDGTTAITNTYNATNPRLRDSVEDRAGHDTTYTYTKQFQTKTIETSLDATTTYAYDELGRVSSETNQLSEETSYTYDQFGQVLTITYPDHVASSNERVQTITYTAYGQTDTKTGAGTYDVDYGYDLAGDLTTMTTYYGASDTAATTIWHYNDRNQLERKEFPDASDYDYTYDDAGNLKTRTDALSQQTKYYYDEYNLLEVIDYPNDTDVLFAYDSLGRRFTLTEGGTADSSGNYSGGSLRQKWLYHSSNLLANHWQHSVNRRLDYEWTAEGKRESVLIRPIGGAAINTITYDYDAAGRLETILDPEVDGSIPFKYAYQSNANLIEDVLFPVNANESLRSKITRDYDVLGRLDTIETLNSAGTRVDFHDYTYNSAGLRSEELLADGTTREYDYDANRQLVEAIKSTADPNFNFDYVYDEIGNRLSYDDDTDSTTYTPNDLNEYTGIALNGGTPAVPVYDDNGSLEQLGNVEYEWDDENRLVAVFDDVAQKRTEYTYDGLSKRVSKEDFTGTSSTSWTAVSGSKVKFAYDMNLVLRDLDASNNLIRGYTRGLDVIQTLQGAGGVGSLLAVTERRATTSDYGFYYYDGNGNVTGLLAADDTVIVTYEYDPFGNELLGETPAGGAGAYPSNVYLFSTKEYEADWDLNYYLYRFYSPELGRWLSRDSIGEKGGLNLYGFVGNDPIRLIDIYGLCKKDDCEVDIVFIGVPTGINLKLNTASGSYNFQIGSFGMSPGEDLKDTAFTAARLLKFLAKGGLASFSRMFTGMVVGIQAANAIKVYDAEVNAHFAKSTYDIRHCECLNDEDSGKYGEWETSIEWFTGVDMQINQSTFNNGTIADLTVEGDRKAIFRFARQSIRKAQKMTRKDVEKKVKEAIADEEGCNLSN